MNRIDRAFAERRRRHESALIFFLTAGYPDVATTEATIDVLAECGADLIELGIPFSDPIADGPTIQFASQAALDGGITVQAILDMTARVRARHPELALVLFTAYNPVLRRGVARFAADAAAAGADGLLVPDLPPEEAGELCAAAQQSGLATIFLVAPTTSEARMRLISEASTGFVYYVSLRGVTGARAELPPDLEPRVRALKQVTEKPVAVGFGVSQPEQARAIAGFADGVIVGSALVKLMIVHQGSPELPARVRQFASALAEAVAGRVSGGVAAQ